MTKYKKDMKTLAHYTDDECFRCGCILHEDNTTGNLCDKCFWTNVED